MAEDYPRYGPDLSGFLIVVIPTFDLYGYLPLVAQLYGVAESLGRGIVPCIPDRYGVWHSIQEGIERVAKRFDVDGFRALICGSDTHIENPKAVASCIRRADEEGSAFVANMKMRGDDLRGIDGGYHVKFDVKDWEVVHPKGFGFYYGPVSASYRWHSDSFAPEDFRFLTDNGIEVHYAKEIKLLHYIRRFA